MKFRTEIERVSFPFKLDIDSQILSLGSCFAQVIGEYLDNYKIINSTNPFGVLFNPISIGQNLLTAINNTEASPLLFTHKDEASVHFEYHSIISAENEIELADIIKRKNIQVSKYLKSADLLILTFGTAWVHVLNKSEKIVANCHKQNSSQFSKRLITETEFKEVYNELILKLKEINPNLQILLSVSPVIHSREGLIGNSVSKSTLIHFSHLLVSNHENVSYFPGYEIVTNDLRDYRFYKDDLIHPAPISERYILDYFMEQVGSQNLKNHIASFTKLKSNMAHRPFNEYSISFLNHLQRTLEELKDYPYKVDLEKEINSIDQKIKELQKAIKS